MTPTSGIKSRDITGFVVLLAFLLLAGAVLTQSAEQGPRVVSIEQYPDPSVDNTRASGSEALYEWTRSLGYRPSVWRSNFLNLPDDSSVVFCIAPNLYAGGFGPMGELQLPSPHANRLTAAEGRAVRNWVARGHTLILFASSLPAPSAVSDVSGAASDSFSKEIGVDCESALGGAISRNDYAPLEPSIWTDGVTAIHIHPGASIYRAANDSETLFGGVMTVPARAGPRYQRQPVAMVYTIGRGQVVAVADDLFGCNANLARAHNALFIRRVLSLCAKPGAGLLFDEFHRGDAGGSPSIWSALGRPAQFGIVQIIIAVIVGILVLIPRLGRPEPAPDRVERSTAEYVSSLASLYRNAGAGGAALDTVYRQFLREICQRYGLAAGTTLERLADVAARRGGVDGPQLRQLLIACERALESQRTPHEKDLITLVRAIERFRKELGIG